MGTTMIKTILRGCGYTPQCGHHPGTLWLVYLTIIGIVAGGWLGGVAMLAMFGPLYLFGAYERGKIT